jgi:hypothetical protein
VQENTLRAMNKAAAELQENLRNALPPNLRFQGGTPKAQLFRQNPHLSFAHIGKYAIERGGKTYVAELCMSNFQAKVALIDGQPGFPEIPNHAGMTSNDIEPQYYAFFRELKDGKLGPFDPTIGKNKNGVAFRLNKIEDVEKAICATAGVAPLSIEQKADLKKARAIAKEEREAAMRKEMKSQQIAVRQPTPQVSQPQLRRVIEEPASRELQLAAYQQQQSQNHSYSSGMEPRVYRQ